MVTAIGRQTMHTNSKARVGRFNVKLLTTSDLLVENAVRRLNTDYVYCLGRPPTTDTHFHIEYNDLRPDEYGEAMSCAQHSAERQRSLQEVDELLDMTRRKTVVVEKKKGQPMGFSVVWSEEIIPCLLVARLDPQGAASWGAELMVGDKVLAVDGRALTGLGREEACQILVDTQHQTRVTLVVVACPPVDEYSLCRLTTDTRLGLQVNRGVILRVASDGLASRHKVRPGHRIVKIEEDGAVHTSIEQMTEALHTFVGSISITTMPLALYDTMTSPHSATPV
eukprot:comp91242_c0_seq1/m.48553 comp91242_c0_seq1/g.48553  ORF comp91242_c0_seq1/g.48553 comp91242_c0_seq1/m.48553 type:complete len:281 (-) comp91242_c0_seq1:35-877(-)